MLPQPHAIRDLAEVMKLSSFSLSLGFPTVSLGVQREVRSSAVLASTVGSFDSRCKDAALFGPPPNITPAEGENPGALAGGCCCSVFVEFLNPDGGSPS